MPRIAILGRALLVLATLMVAGSFAQGPPPRPPGNPPQPPPGRPPMPPTPTRPAPPAPPPLGQPIAGLTPAQLGAFQVGRAAFIEVEDVPGGLGPVFTEASCLRCHLAGGGSGERTVTRIGRVVNGQYDDMIAFGGPLIQDHGIGRFNGVNFVGEVVPPGATIIAKRRTTPLYGLGLVDAVPDQVFITLAQVEAHASPATAGRVSVATDMTTGHNRVGKFGWKGQHSSLFDFAADAYQNEIGVTSPLTPQENAPQGNASLLAANPAVTNPNDTTNETIHQLSDFLTGLAPPPPAPSGATERAGAVVFSAIGCANCHMPIFLTGHSPIAALSGVIFSPYSDFLLHDMGSLGDGIVQGNTGPTEMRTAPLWGLRFQTTLLHDGRARTPTDAILAHDGQGHASRNGFNALNATQRAQLLAFLNSL